MFLLPRVTEVALVVGSHVSVLAAYLVDWASLRSEFLKLRGLPSIIIAKNAYLGKAQRYQQN